MTHLDAPRFAPTRRQALVGAGALLLAGPAAAETLETRGYALGDMTMGSPDAPVTVIEYASLTCPHCADFHKNTWPALKEQYVDTGKVRFVFREVYFDQFGLWGGMLARCGGEGPYFGFVDLLLAKQDVWARQPDEASIVDEIRKIGRQGGLPNERIDACLTDNDLARSLVDDFRKNSQEDGIQSTPSFLVNGELIAGNQGLAALEELINKHL